MSFGCLKSVKLRGLYFWQKPNGAKAFTHFVWDFAKLHFAYEILRRIWDGIAESKNGRIFGLAFVVFGERAQG